MFRAERDARGIERITELEAGPQGGPCSRTTRRASSGLRVARALEEPSDKPEVFTDATGKPTPVPVLDNDGVNGIYTSSEGVSGAKVWGTRGRWMALAGTVADEDVVLLMVDHPKNPGYPTYWHARGYGLFAANPLGQAAFSNGKETLDFTLAPGAKVSFRHRLLVLPGPFSRERAEQAACGLREESSESPWRSRRVSSAAATSRTRTPARRARRGSGSPPSTATTRRKPRRWPRASAGARSPATRTSWRTGRWTWS